jgi:hypothetical protein
LYQKWSEFKLENINLELENAAFIHLIRTLASKRVKSKKDDKTFVAVEN